MTDIETRVRALLAELGDDADTIAETLHERGITGGHGGNKCPLYRYLHAELPAVSWVSAISVEFYEGTAPRAVLLRDPAREFVHNFDRNAYPELVETAVES